MAQMNLGQALWHLGEVIAMLKRFKITAALTKAGVSTRITAVGDGSDGVPAGQEGRRVLHAAPTNSR